MSLKDLRQGMFAILISMLLFISGCFDSEFAQQKDFAKDGANSSRASSKLAQRVFSTINEADRLEIFKYENQRLAIVTRENKRFADLNHGILAAKDYPEGPNRSLEFLTLKWIKGEKVIETLQYKSDRSVSTNRYSENGISQALLLDAKTWQLLESIAEPNWQAP